MTIRKRRAFSTRAGIGIAGVAVAALAAACGSSTSGDASAGSSASASGSSASAGGSTAATSAAEIKAGTGDLGTFLTDGSGRTVYLFRADSGGKPTCNGSCAAQWPPLTTKGKPEAGSGVQASQLSTVKRGDGTSQVTYHGHPLYRFAGDSKAGDTNGQGSDGFGAKWYVLSPSGGQITKQPAGSSTGSGSTGGSGHGGGGGYAGGY